jgi:hypothetical protein
LTGRRWRFARYRLSTGNWRQPHPGWRFFIRQENFMLTSRADVATEHASRYLQQLCKHWSHKFPVEFDPRHGAIQLSIGRTVMDADDQALHIALAADDEASLDRLETVVADHIKRFAFREELSFDWQKAA